MQGGLEVQPFTAVQQAQAALQAVKTTAAICFFYSGKGIARPRQRKSHAAGVTVKSVVEVQMLKRSEAHLPLFTSIIFYPD